MSQIDINQRIPLSILEIALKAFLVNDYNTEYLLEQLAFEYSGQNRIAKALRIVNKIILKNPLTPILLDNKQEILNALKHKGDRSVILIAMLNSAYSFSFDTLNIFAKYFQVQTFINTELIKKESMNKYGSNRSTQNGLYSVIPMFLEAEFFLRTKPGLYQTKEKLIIQSKIANKLYLQSFILNNSLLQDSEIIIHEPYFAMVEVLQ
jgi:hypothetical protein